MKSTRLIPRQTALQHDGITELSQPYIWSGGSAKNTLVLTAMACSKVNRWIVEQLGERQLFPAITFDTKQSGGAHCASYLPTPSHGVHSWEIISAGCWGDFHQKMPGPFGMKSSASPLREGNFGSGATISDLTFRLRAAAAAAQENQKQLCRFKKKVLNQAE